LTKTLRFDNVVPGGTYHRFQEHVSVAGGEDSVGHHQENDSMMWAFIAAVVAVVAAVCFFYYFSGRRNQSKDVQVCVTPNTAKSFYPEVKKCHAINTRAITCSCPDFRNEREQFRHDDPRRLCKHLVRSFIDAKSLPEDLTLYKEGIEQSAGSHRGFPTNRTRFDERINGERISIMIPREITEEDPWIDVYCDARRYSYSPGRERWADETAPPREEQVIGFLYERLGKPIPEAMIKRIRTLPRVPIEEEERDSRKTADRKPGAWRDVESVLRTLLPPDGELTLRQTKSYVVVAFNGSRKWICRLCVHSKKSKYIEFPGGRRYALNCVEDITQYREQLIDAYGGSSPKKGKERMLFPLSETTPSRYNLPAGESRDNVNNFSRN
jgi:hypothetical protein